MSETRPFRPSNGTHGEIFQECFCYRCKRDAKYQETENPDDGCKILADALWFDEKDPEYPKEWVEDVGSEPGMIGAPGARCTAFEPIVPRRTK